MSIVAEFLGKRPEQMKSVIELDGLPVINSPCETKAVPKCSLLGLHRWLSQRSQNSALTVDELERELERAADAVRQRNEARKQRKEARAAA
jgi:hypothetical protein